MKMAPHFVLFDGVVDHIDFFHVGLGGGEKIRMSLRGRVGGAVVLIGKRDDLNEASGPPSGLVPISQSRMVGSFLGIARSCAAMAMTISGARYSGLSRNREI